MLKLRYSVVTIYLGLRPRISVKNCNTSNRSIKDQKQYFCGTTKNHYIVPTKYCLNVLKNFKQENRILLLILKVFWSRVISYVNIKDHRKFHFRFKFLTIDYGHIFQDLVTFNRIFLQYSTKWIMYNFA